MTLNRPLEHAALTATDQPCWIEVGTLVEGTTPTPTYRANVVYNKQGILFVGDAGETPPSHLIRTDQSRPDISLPEYTLLPGLIEAHAHIFLEGGELDFGKRKEYLENANVDYLTLAKARLKRLRSFGVIGIRDAGDKDGVGLAMSKLYKEGIEQEIPYIESPGAAINREGRYGSFMSDALENHESIRACVKSRIDQGADRIKIIPTGIINFKAGKVTKEPQMDTATIAEIVAIAKEFGKQTFAHASGDDGIEYVIEAGVDSVEHGFFLRDDQLAKMRDREIAWVPTFAPVQMQVDLKDRMGYDDTTASNLQRILDNHAKSLYKAAQMGVLIIAGSDAGSYAVPHGEGLIFELEVMEKAGMSPIQVINAATGVSSDRFQYGEQFGRIKRGYKSRFILTKHSPLDRISNLRREKIIIFDGQASSSIENLGYSGL